MRWTNASVSERIKRTGGLMWTNRDVLWEETADGSIAYVDCSFARE